jgi:hypothetical protein
MAGLEAKKHKILTYAYLIACTSENYLCIDVRGADMLENDTKACELR